MSRIMAGYVRVSTEMQADRDSVMNQEENIISFAEKKGVPYRIFRDIGMSAKDKQRPAFQAILEDIKEGKIDSVVVAKLDRITRSLKDLIFLKEFFEEHEVTFIALTQNLDTSTPMGRFSFYVLGLVAQLEREVTAERVIEVMKGRALKKKWNGGVVPYGFTSQKRKYKEWLRNYVLSSSDLNDEKQLKDEIKKLEGNLELRARARDYAIDKVPKSNDLVLDESEAEGVKHIFELYIQSKSFRKVTHKLNASGNRTRKGYPWATTSVKRILQNPIYYGTLTYNKRQIKGKTSKPRPKDEHIWVENVFEAIISKETYDEVQEIIVHQSEIPPKAKSSTYLLTGLVKCGLCDSRMYGYTLDDSRRKAGRVYQYYRCNGHLHKGNSVCEGNTVDLKYLDTAIVGELKNFKLNPEKLTEKIKDYNSKFMQEFQPLTQRKKVLQESINTIDRKISRVFSLYEDEIIDKEEFAKRKGYLHSQRNLLEEEFEEINQKIMVNDVRCVDLEITLGNLKNLAEIYDGLDFTEKKELLSTIVGGIVVGKDWIDYSIYALNRFFVNYDCTDRDSWRLPA